MRHRQALAYVREFLARAVRFDAKWLGVHESRTR